MPQLVPVDHDPFASDTRSGVVRADIPDNVTRVTVRPSGPQLVPVDHDPFAEQSVAEDVAKSAGVGVAKGAIGIAGFPDDARNLMAYGAKLAFEKLGLDKAAGALAALKEIGGDGATSKNIQEKIVEPITGKFYEPQTRAGSYAETIGEFAPGGVGGGVSKLTRAARVVLPATASEAAGEATAGSKYEPFARFFAALGGGLGAGIATRPGTAARSIAESLPQGVTEQMVIGADSLMQEAARRGVQLAWPEALSQVSGRPVLTNVMRHLEASPQTEAQMSEFFARRPQQVESAVRGELNNVAPVNAAPSTIGHEIGRAAEGTINDVRGAINKTAEPFYKNSESVTLDHSNMQRVEAIPGYREARDAVRNDPQLNRYVSQLPDNSVGFLNEVKKQLDRSGKDAVGPLNTQPNMQRAAGLSKDAESVRNTATNASTDYGTALAIESVAREKYLQPLLDGPLGKIASKDTGTRNAIDALFPKNPLANSEREIGTTVSALAHRNPRAASDLVRAHAEGTFNEAARDLQTGPNQAMGAKFAVAISGNPQQRANLQAAIEALPNGAERWQGFNKLLDVMEATGTRQNVGSRTAYNVEINKAQGAGGFVRDTAKIASNPIKALQPLIDTYQQWKLGKNLGQLATILTDQRSSDMLRAIASSPKDSGKSAAMALRLITYENSARSKSTPQINRF